MPKTPRATEDVLEFLRIVWELNHHLQSASKRMARTLGITGPQRLAIRMIGREPGMPTLRLSALLHLHPSTVTGILDRLERDGLVQRVSDPADARSTRLHLTRRGHAIDRASTGTVEASVGQALGRLAPVKVTAGRTVLAAVCSALERATTEKPQVRSGRPAPRTRRARSGSAGRQTRP